MRRDDDGVLSSDNYKHYHTKFLAATGKPPAPPKVAYPKGAFLGPAAEEKDKSKYWLRIYQVEGDARASWLAPCCSNHHSDAQRYTCLAKMHMHSGTDASVPT